MAIKRRFLYAPGVQEAFSLPPRSSFLSPLLVTPAHRAAFLERFPHLPTSTDKNEALAHLAPVHQEAALSLGFPHSFLAEQIHGNQVALITPTSPRLTPGADALITQHPDTLLGIHVADCGPLYLVDQTSPALALVHSGKKGTELNIAAQTIDALHATFGTLPQNLIAVLGPCIRPPHYDPDFAATIRQQVLAAGLLPENYHDSQLCTASNLDRFYSYRLEKGDTGRHLCLLGTLSQPAA